MKKLISLFLILFFANSAITFSEAFSEAISENRPAKILTTPPKIISSINPIYQIAKFISGDEKNNSLLFDQNASEYRYFMKPSDIDTLNNVDVIFYVSNDMEITLASSLSKITSTPKIVQLVTSKNIKVLSYQTRVGQVVVDPNIWLSPTNAIGIATEIADTLSALYPQGADTYKQNLEKFKFDVKNMDEQNKVDLANVKEKSFVVDLDRLAYFENYYALKDAAVIRYNYDDDPKLEYINKVNNIIKSEQTSCMLGSTQERTGLSFQIANNNKINFILIDVIGNPENNYVRVMRDLVSSISKCVINSNALTTTSYTGTSVMSYGK